MKSSPHAASSSLARSLETDIKSEYNQRGGIIEDVKKIWRNSPCLAATVLIGLIICLCILIRLLVLLAPTAPSPTPPLLPPPSPPPPSTTTCAFDVASISVSYIGLPWANTTLSNSSYTPEDVEESFYGLGTYGNPKWISNVQTSFKASRRRIPLFFLLPQTHHANARSLISLSPDFSLLEP